MAAERPIPIRRVRRTGAVDELGEWRPESHRLVLHSNGFPLAPPGSRLIEGELPWVFDELAPDGFLASRFSKMFPDLQLPAIRNLWTARHVVDAISIRGHDLAGNLLVGEGSHQRFLNIFRAGSSPGPRRSEAPRHYPVFVDQVLRADVFRSSVGGARPKFALRLDDGSGVIVKFTPPLSTPAGRRWADLLRMEAHASAVLRGDGIEAAVSRYFEIGARGYLEIDRFDRLVGGGRTGHVTLFHLAVALYQELVDPLPVVQALVRDGHLQDEDAIRFGRIHSFSRAIANTDTHLGNYGLLIDDEGRARLAPAYDVLPMAFAPRHDELPDGLVSRVGARDAATGRLVERLIAAVRTDHGISREFAEAWLRVVG
jgi:hypothetical protein